MADTEIVLTPAEACSDEFRAAWRVMAAVMYNTYGDSVGWKAVSGHPMPPFSEVGRRVEGAWCLTAMAALSEAARTRPVR